MIGIKIKRGTFPAIRMTAERALDQVERRGMKAALMKAARPMRKRARELVPVESGDLKRSIGIAGRTDARSGEATVMVGPRRKYRGKTGRHPAWYAHLVEFGHVLKRGDKTYGFVGPKPYLRPAFESTKDESRRIYGQLISGEILRAFARAKKGGRI